ncbi:hypothetical protein QOT17_024648 [Balamuthia mandrillaris]
MQQARNHYQTDGPEEGDGKADVMLVTTVSGLAGNRDNTLLWADLVEREEDETGVDLVAEAAKIAAADYKKQRHQRTARATAPPRDHKEGEEKEKETKDNGDSSPLLLCTEKEGIGKRLVCNTTKKPKKKKQKEGDEHGRKLFVGGVLLRDLEERAKSEETDASKKKERAEEWRQLRLSCLEAIFREFGELQRFNAEHWEKRYCHVVYRREEDAKTAFERLGSSSEKQRKQCFEASAKQWLEEHSLPTFIAPSSSSFYVRWPKEEEPKGGGQRRMGKKTGGLGKKKLKKMARVMHRKKRDNNEQNAKRQKQKMKGVQEEEDEDVARVLYWQVISTNNAPDWGKLNAFAEEAEKGSNTSLAQRQHPSSPFSTVHPKALLKLNPFIVSSTSLLLAYSSLPLFSRFLLPRSPYSHAS